VAGRTDRCQPKRPFSVSRGIGPYEHCTCPQSRRSNGDLGFLRAEYAAARQCSGSGAHSGIDEPLHVPGFESRSKRGEVSVELAAVLIAGLAILVSVIALILGEKRERERSGREEAAEKRAEKAEMRARNAEKRDEERARREEIELQSSQQGRPTTDPARREPGQDRAYRFLVTNIGRSSMSDLKPELVDSSGEICSQPLPNMFLGALQPGERIEFVLNVTDPIDRDPLFLHYTWFDMTGFRERLSNVAVPPA